MTVLRALGALFPWCALAGAEAPRGIDPYPYIHGGTWGPPIAASPDPTANYTWDLGSLHDPLAYQCIHSKPESAVAEPASSFLGVATLTTDETNVTVLRPGVLKLSWPQNGACWFEFTSEDLASPDIVTMGISESDMPAPLMSGRTPKQHGATWRNEPNANFYDGVRFAWINVTQTMTKPWHITGLRRVCQVVPINYVGHFESSDKSLDRIWWTGAYTVKVTVNGNGAPGKTCPPGKTGTKTPGCGGFLGSELLDRGDRIAFLGDAHVTQAAALVAFGNNSVLASSINYTRNIGNTIQPYWVMWVNSVIDYWDATGDESLIRELIPWVVQRLSHAQQLYEQARSNSAALRWSRDDDRMGFGFEFPDSQEAQRAFRALTIEAHSRWSAVMRQIGNNTAAEQYGAQARKYISELRGDVEWWSDWGMHASADAINAGIPSPLETIAIMNHSLSDPLQLPSLSNFESHFVLRALGSVNASDLALGLVRRHWSYVTDLGATTTWERFDPEWHDVGALHVDGPPVNAMNDRTSMAHPWAAGATTFLSTFGIGIRPMTPGYKTWQALPRLMGSAGDGRIEFVRGRVPVPGGTYAGFEMDLRDGTCITTIPSGTMAQIGVPRLRTGLKFIFLEAVVGENLAHAELAWVNQSEQNLRLTSQVSLAASRGIRVAEDSEFVLIDGLLGGTGADNGHAVFRFRFEHVGNELTSIRRATRQQALQDRLPVKFLGIETKTSGQWIGTYGGLGHMLFNYSSSNHEDVVSLPDWVVGIWSASLEDSADQKLPNGNFRKDCGTPWNPDLPEAVVGAWVGPYQCVWVWDTIANDTRIPEAPPGFTSKAVAAAVRGKHWGGSFHVDVELNSSIAGSALRYVDIALYLVDYHRWSASAVVKAMDLTTKRLVAPMAHVTPEAYNAGAYVRYRYPTSLGRGMRFRIEQVHSDVGDRHSVRSLGYPPQAMLTAVFLDEPKQDDHIIIT